MDWPVVLSDVQGARRLESQSAGDCDCDCACPSLPTSRPYDDREIQTALRHPKRLRRAPSLAYRADEAHMICIGPDHDPVVLNQAAYDLVRRFDDPRTLSRALAEVRATWGRTRLRDTLAHAVAVRLLVPIHAPTPPVATTTTLTAWLQLTNRCNLRCTYCYLPHTSLDMSEATGRAAVDATISSAQAHNYRRVKFKYAGGEALIRFPLVAALHRYAQAQAAERGLDLDGVVLSNGTLLTSATAETLQRLGLRLMISLDGIGDYHDAQRPYIGGQGSFQQVDRSLAVARSAGLRPEVSITVTKHSATGLAEVIAWLLAEDFPFRINFYRQHEHVATDTGLHLDEQRIIDSVLRAYRVIEVNLPRRSLLASLVDLGNLSMARRRPCSVGEGYLVFDHAGGVAPCQMHMDATVSSTSADDPLADIRHAQSMLQNPDIDEKEECRGCSWRHWCAGGCPLAAFRASGRYDARSPNCAIYQAIYPAAVRLEGLRLLKYAANQYGETAPY